MMLHQTLEGPQIAGQPSRLADQRWLTRVLVVDARPAVRAGLSAVIAGDPALSSVASIGTGREALEQTRILRPDVVVVGDRLSDEDGLILTHRLRSLEYPPAVLLRTRSVSPAMAVLAMIAGAAGITSKSSDSDELRYAIRWIARGGSWMPEVPPTTLSRLAARLDPRDAPILGMLLHGTRPAKIAEVLGISNNWFDRRRWHILDQLRQQP